MKKKTPEPEILMSNMLDACTIDVTKENDFAQNQLGSKFSKYSLKLLDSTPNKGGKKNLTQKPTELVENIKNHGVGSKVCVQELNRTKRIRTDISCKMHSQTQIALEFLKNDQAHGPQSSPSLLVLVPSGRLPEGIPMVIPSGIQWSPNGRPESARPQRLPKWSPRVSEWSCA